MNQQVAVVTTAAAVGLSIIYLLLRPKQQQQQTAKKLHIKYEHPRLPFAIRAIARLPAFLRRPLLVKVQAPKPPLDGVDLIGPEYNPYSVRVLEPNTIWRVRYKYVRDPALTAALKDMFGIDLCDKSVLNKLPVSMRQQVEKQIDAFRALRDKNVNVEDATQRQRNELEAGLEDSQDMLVARLIDGTLLLYNPCRMHPYIIDYLSELGTVAFIVSGSSVHTNQLPQAAKVFPNAKIICAQAADDKCQVVGMRQADFLYTDHDAHSTRGFDAAQAELEPLGVQLHHIQGDVQTQSLLLIVHDHLFDVDLSCYSDGTKSLHMDHSQWQHPHLGLAFGQIVHYAGTQDSAVRGYLPNYRLMAMDPCSDLARFNLDAPQPTSCMEMAASLRSLLKLEFKYVDNVHSKMQQSLPASSFIQCIEHSWRWLDGKTLL